LTNPSSSNSDKRNSRWCATFS